MVNETSTSLTNANDIIFNVGFNYNIDSSTLTAGDFTLSGTATGCQVSGISGSGMDYRITVSNCSPGTVALNLNQGSVTAASDSSVPTVTQGIVGPSNSLVSNTVLIDRTPPIATLTEATIRPAGTFTGRSSETGTLYIVHSSISVSNLGDITSAADKLWNTVSAPTANASVTIASTGLDFGDYKLYALDLAGNLSTLDTETAKYWPTQVTITYNANGSTSGSVPANTVTQETNTVTLRGNTGNLIKTGSTLVGWNTSASGGLQTRFFFNESYSVTTNTTLYAEWITSCATSMTFANSNQIESITTTNQCAYVVPAGVSAIDLYMIGGGGGGAGNAGTGGSGGGLNIQLDVPVTPGQVVISKIGPGGGGGANTVNGVAGSATTITINRETYTAGGGSGGLTYSSSSKPSICSTTTGAPSGGVGGGSGVNGGRGGWSSPSVNTNACNGVLGISANFTGVTTTYASGGGGGVWGVGTIGAGGGTEAGNGGPSNIVGTAALANRGGGGGGGGAGQAGGAGGSGLFVINYDYLSTVTFDTNTATSGAPESATITQTVVGESITVPSAGTLSKPGFTFAGWNTQADGQGVEYLVGSQFVPQGPLRLFAEWNYLVTYDGNGYTSDSSTVASAVTVTSSISTITLDSPTALTRTGYRLTGWNTQANGLGANYALGSSNWRSPTGAITLYAQWSATISFSLNGADSGTVPSSVNTTGTGNGTFNLPSPTNVRKAGLTFAGWNTTANSTGTFYSAGATYTTTGATTLYAQFNATLTYLANGATSGTAPASVTSPANANSDGCKVATGYTHCRTYSFPEPFQPTRSNISLNLDAANTATMRGTSWYDTTATGAVATAVNSPTYDSGEKAWTLNGTNQYFNVGNVLNYTSGAYTIEVTFKPASVTGTQTLISRYNSGVAGNYYTQIVNGKLRYSHEASPFTFDGPTSLSAGQKYVVTQVFNGSSLTGYLNGIQNGSPVAFGATYASNVNVLVGAIYNSSTPVQFFNGKIYSVRIYGKALTPAEISTNYQAITSPAQTNFDQLFEVPSYIPAGEDLLVETWGAGGGGAFYSGYTGSGAGGAGGYSKSTVIATGNPETWTVVVGQGGEAYDLTPQYGGGGAGGISPSAWKGSSGGGMSGIFIGVDTSTPLLIVGGGGGSSPGSGTSDGGGGGAGYGTGAATTFPARTGRGGTLVGGGAAATATAFCTIAQTPGSSQQGGSGAGHPTISNSEGGGGGGGGYFGGGGGHCYDSQSNGGGGGGSGYANLTRVSIIESTTGASGIVTPATAPGGIASINYSYSLANVDDASIGVGFGGNGNAANFVNAKGGDGLIVIHWNDPSDSWTASSNVNNMERPGFRFGGWNTKADGTGIHYDTGTAIERVNTTLYAEWQYVITYDGNTNTAGVAPADQVAVSPEAVTTLADNPNTLEKTGYYWDGWNESADGKGRNYAAIADLIGLPRPYMHYKAADYNASTKVWADSSGNARNATNVRGTPVRATSNADNGFSRNFATIRGGTAAGITLPNPKLNEYTLCYVARYAGATRNRLFEGATENWLSGFYADATGIAHHNAWITSSTGRANDQDWHIMCDSGDNFRSDGVVKNNATSTTKYLPINLSINAGLYGVQGYNSDWEVAEVIVYDTYFTTTQMQQVESYLADTYGYIPAGTTAGLPTPLLQLEATNYDADARVWIDSSGNNRDVTAIRGNPTVVTNAPGLGATKNVTAVKGAATTAGITLNNPLLPNYTFCYVARYGGTTKGRIFDGYSTNWLSGFYSGSNDVAFHEGWLTGTSGTVSNNWTWNCDAGNTFRAKGITKSTAAGGTSALPATVTINNNGGTGRAGDTSDWEVAEVVIYDRTLTTAQIFQLEGYFTTKYGLWAPVIATKRNTTFASPTGDRTLYAQWNSLITYESNTATSGRVPLPTLMVADTPVVISSNSGTLAKTGNSFLGWNTSSNGTGTLYLANETYTPTANLTLYAQWGSGITFNGNGSTSGSVPSPVTLALGRSETLTSGTIVKTGYTFAGWNTLANGSGTRYETGTAFTPTENITLYAQWNSLIRFDVNGGTGSPNVDSVTATGTLNVTLATAGSMARPGYTFNGWNTRADGTGTLYAAGLTTYTPAGNITLFAKWTGNPYTITFNGNSNTGGSTAAKSITGGTPAALTANGFTRTGYTFSGWSESSTATVSSYADGSTQTFTSNKTLYAIWKPDVYTITYNVNTGALGAASKSSETYTVGTTGVTLATVGTMAKQGYRFTGWSATQAGTTALTSPYVASTSITLYAIWTANQYRVIYESNTATSGSIAPLTFTAGSGFVIANVNSAMVKTGYNPNGWNTRADGTGIAYAGGSTITLYDTTTVYAQWLPVAPAAPTLSLRAGNTSVTITPNGGTLGVSNGPADSYTVTAKIGATVIGSCVVLRSATSCTITGLTNNTAYTFTATATNKTGTSAASTGVVGTPRGFVITYNPAGGVVLPTSETFSVGTPLTLPLPTRSGYNFLGWFDTSTAGTNLGLNGGQYSPSESRTVYAQWSAIPYTIFYNGNGNTSGAVPANGTYSLTSGAHTISGRNTLVKTGYVFNGWLSDTGTVFAVGSTYSRLVNLNLYARWIAETYTVTFNANGATGSAPPTISSITIGETFTAPSTTLLLSGSSFAGWSDGVRTYRAGDVVTVGGANMVLTAIWNGTQYVVNYSLNGGTGTVPTSPNFFLNDTFTVASRGDIVKSGYTFLGWVESGTSYAAGSTYTMPARNITLSAEWTGLVYTITYATTNGTGSPSRTTDSFTFGGTPISLPTAGTLVRPGYTLVGWAETSTTLVGTYSPTASVTLQPVWSATTQTFTFDINGATGTTPATGSYTTGGSAVTAPAQGDLVKPGFTFAGWSDGANNYSAGDPIIGEVNKNLTARWVAASYPITYSIGVVNGVAVTENVGLPSGTSVTYGVTTSLAAPETLTVTDSNNAVYAFGGWSDGVNTYRANSNFVMGPTAMNLTALWLRLYEVRYYMNGGTDPGMTQGVLYQDQAVVTIDSLTPTKIGYTFAGWSTQSGQSASGTYTIDANNYLFYASWNINSYSLGFAATGGNTTPSPVTANFATYTTLPSATAIARSGYSLTGWSIGATAYAPGAQYQFGAASETATAIWTPTVQTITIDLAQGVSNTPISVASKSIGETFTAPSTIPTRTGYTFTGWNDGSSTYQPGAVVTVGATNMVLTAQWGVASFVITYSLNGGTGNIPAPTTHNFDSNHTIAAGVTKSGSNFLGWSNGSNTYSAGATFRVAARNETFTAQFSGAIYALSFSLNGADSGTAVRTLTGQVTDTFTIHTADGITKLGYSFGGWTDGTNIYGAGQDITGVNANTTLTAVWILLPPAALAAPVATPGDHTGSITVTPPSLVNGGEVTSYKIIATDGAGTPISPEKSCLVYSPATSCVITGLVNGETYKFQAVATNSAGTSTSSLSNAIIPASIPGVPTAVTATRGDETATVTFTAPADNGGSAITSYVLTVIETGETFTSQSAPITVTGLTNGSTYTFSVRAINAVGQSDSSTASAPIKVAGVADAPISVTAIPGDETATVSVAGSWSTLSGSGGESVTAIIFTSMDGLHTCTAVSPDTSCVITGLTNGTAYTFTAVAQNAVGNSPATISSLVTPAGTPSAPTTVTAIAGDRSATITFSGADANGSAITSYIITIAPTGDTYTVSSSPATINGLTNGASYTFTVAAINAIGASSTSIATASATPAAAPDAPTSLTVVAGDTSTVVSWTPPAYDGGSPIISYLITASNGATCTAIAPATSCKITGLTNGTSYTFTAQAINAIGTGVASVQSPAAVPAGLPTPPTSISATIGDGQVTLTFSGAGNNGSAITTYTVIAEPGGFTGSSSASPVTVLGLSNGTEYTFRVIATNGVGDSESSTVSVSATPATVPGAPTSISATADNASATVFFTAPSSNGGAPITGYTVTSSPGGATCSAPANATSCVVTGLSNGTAYTFTVAANNGAGSSQASSTSNSVTPMGAPAAPTITAARGDTKATVVITAPTDDGGSPVTQYLILVQPGAQSITTNALTNEIPNLINGTVYTFTVSAINNVGTGPASSAATARPAGVPNPPTTVTAAPANMAAIVTFSGATGNGDDVIRYIVTVVETGDTVTGVNSPIRVNGLTNGTSYTFTVTAVNSIGESTPSQVSVAVIPAQVSFLVPSPPSAPSAPAPTIVTPSPTPSPSPSVTPTPSPSATPTPTPSVTPTPTASPKPSPTASPKASPTASPKASPKATPKPSTTPTLTPSPTPTPSTPKKVAINPSTSGSTAKIGINNLKPGQKIKVTVKEGKTVATPAPSAKATTKPKATPKASSKPTAKATPKAKPSKSPVAIVPKPSGKSAKVGITNLKPGQKIKVTVKTGGTTK
jgi:uncharacterized repeat protein (TIGR02543 family)